MKPTEINFQRILGGGRTYQRRWLGSLFWRCEVIKLFSSIVLMLARSALKARQYWRASSRVFIGLRVKR